MTGWNAGMTAKQPKTKENDRDRIGRLGHAALLISREIERILGEMSPKQHAQTVGAVLGFWCAEEDRNHARADGQSWKDVVRQEFDR